MSARARERSLTLLGSKNFGAPGEIARGATPLGLRCATAHPSGVQLRPRRSCRTRLVLCREFEPQRRASGRPHGVLGPKIIGAPGEIRTPDLLVRSQALYPTELRAQRGNLTVSAGLPRHGARILTQPRRRARGYEYLPFVHHIVRHEKRRRTRRWQRLRCAQLL